MGDEYLKANKGDPVRVAKYLLDQGANVEGYAKYTSPLHQAVVMNQPKLVELLIQRGANLARPNVDGDSPLQVARKNRKAEKCALLLERAGAPLELTKKPKRPKPVRTVDLRQSTKKLQDGLEKAIQRFARKHDRETITAVILASISHEGYVMLSFDTAEYEGSPWDCTFSEFAWIQFPEWTKAHDGDRMRLIDLDGREREDEPDAFAAQFPKMIVSVLKTLQEKGAFKGLQTTSNCKIGIEMTAAGDAKFWKLRKA